MEAEGREEGLGEEAEHLLHLISLFLSILGRQAGTPRTENILLIWITNLVFDNHIHQFIEHSDGPVDLNVGRDGCHNQKFITSACVTRASLGQ